MQEGGRLGIVVAGSLTEGLKVRLDAGTSVEDMRVGKFVKIRGEQHDFFCLVTDVQLAAATPRVLADPPAEDEPLLRAALAGTQTYGLLHVEPRLMLAREAAAAATGDLVPQPVKTIPAHFSTAFVASEADFERVFGADTPGRFAIGEPLDMAVPIRLDLRRFVERSNGVFGKSGTGKSFLTRLLLCGIIQHRMAANLIFDMHSEYGWEAHTEQQGVRAKGLKQLFRGQVFIYTLDAKSARTRGVPYDGEVRIGLDEITLDDIALLHDELRLHPTAVESGSLVVQQYGDRWLPALLEMDTEALRAFCEQHGANVQSLSALRRKLQAHVASLAFVDQRGHGLGEIVKRLEQGQHVVLEFGQHRRLLPYMLVANIITRLIHGRWIDKTERYLHAQDESQRPQPLMITIEEAHRFLNPEAARQTSFGTIAREMRKFFVTLLVVDQRPSGIDPEVLSQLGTRITAQLNDERDIEAIFTGVAGGSKLRQMLASLDSREQALILGHAVPMPVMFRVRKYDEQLYAALDPFGAQRTLARSGCGSAGAPPAATAPGAPDNVVEFPKPRAALPDGDRPRAYDELFPE
jgi:DNA helicase HerA-like ATPase